AVAATERPDVAVIDVHLRGETDGIATATLLRAQYDLPIIFLTGSSDAATFARALALRPEGYLLKPVTTLGLQTSLELALANHATAKRLQAAHVGLAAEKRALEVRSRELAELNLLGELMQICDSAD